MRDVTTTTNTVTTTTTTTNGGGGRAGSSFDDALLKATLEDARCQHTSLGKSAVAQLTSLLKGMYMNKNA
jgi:hypothetical protein